MTTLKAKSPRTTKRKSLTGYSPDTIKVNKNTFQSHCIIGTTAYQYGHENRPGLYLLNNLLGGPGMNSRLNLSLREKKGFTYNIESSFNPYSDTGIFSIYFGTDNSNLEKSIAEIKKELKNLRERKLGSLQLSKAKKQLVGHLAISSENMENYMLSMGKSILVFNHVETLEEINKKIENITAEKILEIANDIFEEKSQSLLIYY